MMNETIVVTRRVEDGFAWRYEGARPNSRINPCVCSDLVRVRAQNVFYLTQHPEKMSMGHPYQWGVR